MNQFNAEIKFDTLVPNSTYLNCCMKLLSIDDHPIFSQGLASALKSRTDEHSVAIANTPQEALSLLKSEAFDLILLDVVMPELDGITFMRAMLARNICVPVMLITATSDVSLFRAAINLGAVGILLKTASIEEIELAITNIEKGELVLSPKIKNQLQAVSKYCFENTESLLSVRQLEVIKMVKTGLSNTQIADVLYISERTVKSHLQSIFKILNAKNRVDCIRKAESLNII